jgi:hypothetical protein
LDKKLLKTLEEVGCAPSRTITMAIRAAQFLAARYQPIHALFFCDVSVREARTLHKSVTF